MKTINVDKILTDIALIIGSYESGEFISQEKLKEFHKQLSIATYRLTVENVQSYQKWNTVVYNLSKIKSNAAARVEADESVPELRMSRKILEACKSVSISISNEIKYEN